MLKTLDKYIIKSFLGPFLFIFSVLFFIFIVNIVWIQLAQFTGKGLTSFEIIKLLFYMGVSVVSMVTPLSILLASIMAFGSLGERYELVAMKSSGISLFRIMKPLFFLVLFLSGILFIFSNNVIPNFNKKAKNMLYNIAVSKPALNFVPGVFVDFIPGITAKFDKILGEKGEKLDGIIIHKNANIFENQRTIIAKKGLLIPAKDPHYLKLVLYNGFVYEDKLGEGGFNERAKQPNQAIKFDSLVTHFDISELINNAIESQKITDYYQFQSYNEINQTIKQINKENENEYNTIGNEFAEDNNHSILSLKNTKQKNKAKEPFKLDTLKPEKQVDILLNAYKKIDILKQNRKSKDEEIYNMIKYNAVIIIYQQRILAYPFTCIIFFLIGSSLGSIIRKGGMGLPVVLSIFVFIILYVLNLTAENISWKGNLNPYLAAWLPNIIFTPFGIWLSFKALKDSQLFDVEKYKSLFKPIIQRFVKNKEHQRYQ